MKNRERRKAERKQPVAPQAKSRTGPAAPAAKAKAVPRSADRLQAIERRKSRSRAIGLSIFVLFIMLITVLLIITVMQQARPRPRFVFITGGRIDHTVRSTGLILRDETIIDSPAEGLLKPVTVEGSRVASGQKLAVVIPAGREDQLLELQKAEKDMVDLQLELMQSGQEAGAQAIYAESNAALLPIINLIRQDAANNMLGNLDTYDASIEVILSQRTAKLMTVDFRDARLVELQNVRNRLELSLGLEAGTLKSQVPGLVSYKLDGLEAELGLEAAEFISPGQISSYIGRSDTFNSSGQQIAAGQQVLRIVDNIRQRLVFLLPDTRDYEFRPDEFYDLYIPAEGVSIPSCRLIRTEQAGDDLLAVFQTDRLVERFSDRRTLEAEIIKSSTYGLKVPAGSLLELDPARGQARVMIVSGGFTRLTMVRVLDSDQEHAIIESWPDEELQISESTVLVINPDAIEAGEYIGN